MAHFHSRGTNSNHKNFDKTIFESFPHAWDKIRLFRFQLFQCAIHSHGRGTNSTIWSSPSALNESFPRTWDKLWMISASYMPVRLIPTHVGQTTSVSAMVSCFTTHSHARGTNQFIRHSLIFPTTHSHARGTNPQCSVHASSSPDSFPRTWDKLLRAGQFPVIEGLIPTHVGQTIHVNALIEIKPDSFPRTWDKLDIRFFIHCALRLIPTHVGQTKQR